MTSSVITEDRAPLGLMRSGGNPSWCRTDGSTGAIVGNVVAVIVGLTWIEWQHTAC